MINPFFKAIALTSLIGSKRCDVLEGHHFPGVRPYMFVVKLLRVELLWGPLMGNTYPEPWRHPNRATGLLCPLLCSHPALPTPWTVALSPQLCLSLSLLSILRPESTADGPQIDHALLLSKTFLMSYLHVQIPNHHFHNKYLWSTYYGLRTMLSMEHTMVSKRIHRPCPHGV